MGNVLIEQHTERDSTHSSSEGSVPQFVTTGTNMTSSFCSLLSSVLGSLSPARELVGEPVEPSGWVNVECESERLGKGACEMHRAR